MVSFPVSPMAREETTRGSCPTYHVDFPPSFEFPSYRVCLILNLSFQPIYATISDIVIYSPYGVTPAALAVARRFRQSIKAKRIERMRNAGVDVELLNEPDDVDDAIMSDQAYAG